MIGLAMDTDLSRFLNWLTRKETLRPPTVSEPPPRDPASCPTTAPHTADRRPPHCLAASNLRDNTPPVDHRGRTTPVPAASRGPSWAARSTSLPPRLAPDLPTPTRPARGTTGW